MEEAVHWIKDLGKHHLPHRPHVLAARPDTRYRPSNRHLLEEQELVPLQFMTNTSDADRGILLTRAYFDIHEEPVAPKNHATIAAARSDPNKSITKLSFKDYKNRKKESTPPTGGPAVMSAAKPAPPTSATPKELPSLKKPPPPPVKDMGTPKEKEVKKGSDTKPESGGPRNPTVASSLPRKPEHLQKTDKVVSQEKTRPQDPKNAPLTNGRSVLAGLNSRASSPKPGAQVNGAQKSVASKPSTPQKAEKNSNAKSSVPPLLSPLRLSFDADVPKPQPSPWKKSEDTGNPKPSKKPRDDVEPAAPAPKRRKASSKASAKIPPLLSPTLPPLVMEELARLKKTTPSKDPSLQGRESLESPSSSKDFKTVSKEKDDVIHVESKKPTRESLVVLLRYKKADTKKRVSRLLALPPTPKRDKNTSTAQKTTQKQVPKEAQKQDRTVHERSDGVELGTARKRPRADTDVSRASEGSKRPKTSESNLPTTPLKQATAMSRGASNGSHAGTPGDTSNLTPAFASADRRQTPLADPEKIRKLSQRHAELQALGKKLKHDRDAIMKPKNGARDPPNPSNRDRNTAIGAVLQSILVYMLAFKISDDSRDLERKPRDPSLWSSLLPLMRVVRADCLQSKELLALAVRLQAICHNYLGRSFRTHPSSNPAVVTELFKCLKEEEQAWKIADSARRELGSSADGSHTDHREVAGRFLDRLGPWTTPEDAIPVALDILKKTVPQCKIVPQLLHFNESVPNGISS